MEIKNPHYVWNIACQKVIGCDQEGNEVNTLTPFGSVIYSIGIPTWTNSEKYKWAHEARLQVAEFLKALAAQLEQIGEGK